MSKFFELERELGKRYPEEYNYCSLMALYNRALKDGIVSTETVEKAKEYHGRMWNYVGD